ncbi:MAG: Uma2 family endonuclease [Hyphomicrobiaceae bacterium]
MNIQVSQSQQTTQAAEGLPRRAWTVAEIERMVASGFLDEGERFELIGGEIVPMSARGAHHENVKRALNKFWVRALPPDMEVLTETTLRSGANDFREPDFVFWPSAVADLQPQHVELIVEIADSSLAYDLGRKAAYYASLGLPDYWVIDAQSLVTRVHRDPAGEAYASIIASDRQTFLTPLRLPGLAVRLADLGLDPVT